MAPPVSDLDVFGNLQRPAFRQIPFTIVSFEMDGEQDHAVHKAPDRDGGLVEATGRAPFTWRFSAIFRNGVSGEEDAYPQRWREFVKACADRSVGVLTHPELGDVRAKCKRFTTSWDSGRRDGVDMSLEFVESNDDDGVLTALNKSGTAPLALARSLDDAIGAMNPEPSYPADLAPSLLDSMKQLSGAMAQAKLGLGNIGAQIGSYTGAINDLREQIESFDNPAHVGILSSLDALALAVYDLGEAVVARARPFTQAIVQNTGPLAAVASFFGNTLDDFLRLNPLLAGDTSVAAGTPVFVYLV